MNNAYLCPRADLTDQVIHTHVRDAIQKCLGFFRISEEPCFGLLQQLAPSTLDHICHQCPWRTYKTNKWHLAVERMSGLCDSLVDVAKFLVHVYMLLEPFNVLGRVERVGKGRGGIHLNDKTHGLRDDEDVRENDRSIEKTGVSPDRLHGDLRSQPRSATDLKEFVRFAHFAEF